MVGKLDGKRIAFLVASEGVEQVELTEPWKAVEEAGGRPKQLSIDGGEVPAFNHLDKADTFTVDRTVADAAAADSDGLVSSRKPDDLPAFCAKIVEELCEGAHERQRESVS